ncbi:MAG: hypothetical protein IPP40_14920 [bacterium]|nr:hypothetical protein [bacterium]
MRYETLETEALLDNKEVETSYFVARALEDGSEWEIVDVGTNENLQRH